MLTAHRTSAMEAPRRTIGFKSAGWYKSRTSPPRAVSLTIASRRQARSNGSVSRRKATEKSAAQNAALAHRLAASR
jgi:hypothetical protein